MLVGFNPYESRYLTEEELKPFREQLNKLMDDVYNDVSRYFTFQRRFVGSVARNMVIYDIRNNAGFDFDIDLMVNKDSRDYSEEDIKCILMDSFKRFMWRYGYNKCEDNTRVFTIKKIGMLCSCDFAIIKNYGQDRGQKIILKNKQGFYSWQEQSKGYLWLPKKIKFCTDRNLWSDVRDLYWEKKDSNTNPNKQSRCLLAETVNEICLKHGYKKNKRG